MELELKNAKGTKDYLPGEQITRNRIRATLEKVFALYGYQPLETPILCRYDVLASKYAGGAEILKEIYQLQDQGERELALRYDLTVPFAKVIGMNPEQRHPFKRYEIGKVFRDGPVKAGRLREFIQCDVDVVGVSSQMAEAELIAMVFPVFAELELPVYVSYNNRKLLKGLILEAGAADDQVNTIMLSLDKLVKIGRESVAEELREKEISPPIIGNLFQLMDRSGEEILADCRSRSANVWIEEGSRELAELDSYLAALGLAEKVRFNPWLARGLDVYTGTVYEIFLEDSEFTSSIGAGGRYDRIIGAFLEDGNTYPAVGISFGLDAIYAAMTIEGESQCPARQEVLLIPLGEEAATLSLAETLRKNGLATEVDMSGRKLKKSLEVANKDGFPFVLIIGETERQNRQVTIKSMADGKEISASWDTAADTLISLGQTALLR